MGFLLTFPFPLLRLIEKGNLIRFRWKKICFCYVNTVFILISSHSFAFWSIALKTANWKLIWKCWQFNFGIQLREICFNDFSITFFFLEACGGGLIIIFKYKFGINFHRWALNGKFSFCPLSIARRFVALWTQKYSAVDKNVNRAQLKKITV